MKKIIFVLAICFIAAPAFAVLDVYLVQVDETTVSVMYSGATPTVPSGMPRAFALDLSIDNAAQFSGLTGYKMYGGGNPDESGESNSVYPGYGIYPAQITWLDPEEGEDSRDVNSWGTPLANSADPGAGDGLDSGHIVLEFGSLYYGDVNAPEAAGKLCDLTINCNGETGPVTITMIDEDIYRGGLVYEDGSQDDVTDVLVFDGCVVTTECFPGSPGVPQYDAWALVGKPSCWCASVNPRQCRGDADNLPETKSNFWVYVNDLAILKAAWGKPLAGIIGLTAGGPPAEQICADFDHLPETKSNFRVYVNDLAILKGTWGQAGGPVGDCATLGY